MQTAVVRPPVLPSYESQQAQRERFTLAKADPQVWAKYERRAKRLKKRPRDLAVSDFYQGKNLLVKK